MPPSQPLGGWGLPGLVQPGPHRVSQQSYGICSATKTPCGILLVDVTQKELPFHPNYSALAALEEALRRSEAEVVIAVPPMVAERCRHQA
jgi:hypothetical protein